MNLPIRILAAAFLCAASTAWAAPSDLALACRGDPNARGLPERMQSIRDQMARIELTTDPAEQRALMDLQLKQMHESMREMRRRQPGEGCRLELMHAMMEQMMRFELAARDPAR